MLAMTDDSIVSQTFFDNCQNNLLHNFTRHWSDTDSPVITRVFLLTFLENCDNVGKSQECKELMCYFRDT